MLIGQLTPHNSLFWSSLERNRAFLEFQRWEQSSTFHTSWFHRFRFRVPIRGWVRTYVSRDSISSALPWSLASVCESRRWNSRRVRKKRTTDSSRSRLGCPPEATLSALDMQLATVVPMTRQAFRSRSSWGSHLELEDDDEEWLLDGGGRVCVGDCDRVFCVCCGLVGYEDPCFDVDEDSMVFDAERKSVEFFWLVELSLSLRWLSFGKSDIKTALSLFHGNDLYKLAIFQLHHRFSIYTRYVLWVLSTAHSTCYEMRAEYFSTEKRRLNCRTSFLPSFNQWRS